MKLIALTGWANRKTSGAAAKQDSMRIVKPIDFGALKELIDKENMSQI